MHKTDWQSKGQEMYRIDAHRSEESTKYHTSFLNSSRENHIFSQILNYRVALIKNPKLYNTLS